MDSKINSYRYSKRTFGIVLAQEEVNNYFFEILYEIAPLLFKSVSDIDEIKIEEGQQKKYLVSKFVSYADKCDQPSFEAIESFVRGAMLTETFYYSAPADLQGKMRGVIVYFDTQFLLRAIGLCETKFSEPCLELVKILRSISVKMRCFRHSYDEVYGILFAASSQLKTRGRITSKRPGDIAEYYNGKGAKLSDVELDMAMLEKNLNQIGIAIVDKPLHEENLTVDEIALGEEISAEVRFQSGPSRNHDIDCLTSIHRLRGGRPQKYLESCYAIFITTNTALARASTRFFNNNYGVSDAAVCMSDQVFTTLIWLKAVKKAPNLPKHRLVANCFAALQPSADLWNRYVEEADTLREKGKIDENDYAVLIHSLEARNKLMELTLGQDDIVRGTVQEVLAEAKKKYTEELSAKLRDVTANMTTQNNKLEGLIGGFGRAIYRSTSLVLLILWYGVLVEAVFLTTPERLNKANLFSLQAWAFWFFSLLTLFNLLLGYRAYDSCKNMAQKLSSVVTNWLRKKLIA